MTLLLTAVNNWLMVTHEVLAHGRGMVPHDVMSDEMVS